MEQKTFNEMTEARTYTENEKTLIEFKNKFDSEILPLYEEKKQIHSSVIIGAFIAFNSGKWDEFMKDIKQESKNEIKGDDTNE